MKHVNVYGEEDVYAGWPANHGAWQWGDELLVGFLRGKHNIGGMHNIKGNLEKMLARSLNGGETWSIETPNVDFDAEFTEPAPFFNLNSCILRVCGGYDHGGESCTKDGGFYISKDRGKTWEGAYAFEGFKFTEKQKNTSRTCVLDDLVFLSAANKNHWGSDFIFCCKHQGSKFIVKSIVCDDEARAVMPAAAKLGNRIVVAMRRRVGSRIGGWIDTVYSEDGGLTWSKPTHVAETGQDNGNPPALIASDGKLYCATANRTEHTIDIYKSDNGEQWQGDQRGALRKSGAPDIGYPRLFKRSDGKLICVYYWTENFETPQRIEATIFNGQS